MYNRIYLLILFTAVLLFSQYPIELPETVKGKQLVFIYVHGFGEYGLDSYNFV